jgi:UDP-glucose:(heptosyl)LPS alpha-1,3-glucosyltransferase
MRVALVFRNFNLGGSLERNSVLLARSLAARGVEVDCYCNPETRTVDIPGVTFRDVRPLTESRSRLGYPLECGSFAIAATRALRRDRERYDVVDVRGIAAWDHDVVHVHAVPKAQHRRWAKDRGRSYRAARARAFLAPVLRPQVVLARSIQRLQFRPGRYRRVIAVTEQVRHDLEREYAVQANLIDVIPPPIDIERFADGDRGDLRQELGLRPEDPLLLFVGHAFERKGLAEAIASLPHVEGSPHLVVLGNGDPTAFRRQAARLGLERRVHFVGGSEQPGRFYRDSDLLVLPTRHEPWGIPLIEAMAAGLPVVSTEIAGAADTVRKAGAGVILADTSPRVLGGAISSLLLDPVRRRTMAERGRASARRFGPDAEAESVLAVYRRIVAERHVEQRWEARPGIPAS